MVCVRIDVDRRVVLRPDIVALAHALGRVVGLPENLQQFKPMTFE
jgi:hypothetical protein